MNLKNVIFLGVWMFGGFQNAHATDYTCPATVVQAPFIPSIQLKFSFIVIPQSGSMAYCMYGTASGPGTPGSMVIPMVIPGNFAPSAGNWQTTTYAVWQNASVCSTTVLGDSAQCVYHNI